MNIKQIFSCYLLQFCIVGYNLESQKQTKIIILIHELWAIHFFQLTKKV